MKGTMRILRSRPLVRHLLSTLLILGAAVTSLQAQTSQGAIAGTVEDTTSATVEGAKVTATNLGTGGVTSTVTSSGGAFRFPSLLVGKYEVSASAPGFQTVKQTGVDVQVSSTTAVNIVLP